MITAGRSVARRRANGLYQTHVPAFPGQPHNLHHPSQAVGFLPVHVFRLQPTRVLGVVKLLIDDFTLFCPERRAKIKVSIEVRGHRSVILGHVDTKEG